MSARLARRSLLFSEPKLAGLRISHSLPNVARRCRRARRDSTAQRTIFTIVHQGYEGWRLSFGQNPVKLEPGLRLHIPFYHSIQEVDMREMSSNIKDLSGFTSDNVPVLVSGSLFFRVRDSYNACFAVNDFQANVAAIGTSAMRSVMGHFTYDEVIGDRNKINMKLHEIIGKSIQQWGVDCTRFEIQNFRPSNREVEKQLELQMAAERERRKQMLDTKALVNVAEGHKQRTILESEGEYQSQINKAAGVRQKLIVESEGQLEAAQNQGKALARQVEVLAGALSPEPTSEDKKKALDAILELRRLEQLKAIAEGHGNSTYFFGDSKGTGRDSYEVENMERWKRSLDEYRKLSESKVPESKRSDVKVALGTESSRQEIARQTTSKEFNSKSAQAVHDRLAGERSA